MAAIVLLVCVSITAHIITSSQMLSLELSNVAAVLVVEFPKKCVVLRIFVLCFCGVLLDVAYSSSPHSLILLFANIF